MKTFEFKLPDIGEGVMEGEIVSWLIQLGDLVSEDQPMVEVMTDKATVTITSPKTGKVVQLGGDVGHVVPVHSMLVVLELSNGQASADEAPAAKADDKSEGPAASAVGDIRETLPGMNLTAPGGRAAQTQARGGAAAGGGNYFKEKPLATPATRKLARDLGIDLRTVPPSGANGRVMKTDVQAVAGGAPAAIGQVPMPNRPTGPPLTPRDLEVRTPLRGVRKRIFDAMAHSKHTAAHFTFVEECDVSGLKDLRDKLKGPAQEQGVRLTYLAFIVKAAVAALKRHPALNAAFDAATQEIVTRGYYNIGIASATDAGLMVPVIRDADQRSVLDIANEIDRLSEGSKAGTLSPDELQGSTFTVTSLGKQGGLFATPILNTPEVGILGVHQIKRKPVVRNDEIVIGDVMLLSFSFDHRLIDGHIGAAFAYELIGLLEAPERLWLEMR